MSWIEADAVGGWTVSQLELAELLGVSRQTITAWQDEGLPFEASGVPGEPGRYDTAVVLRWAFRRELAKSRPASPFDRLNEVRARREELALQRELGEIVFVKDIRPALDEFALGI